MNVRNHSPGFAYIFRPEFHSFLYNIIHTIVIHNFFFKRIIIKFGKYFCFIWQNGKYFWQHFLEGKIWMIFNVVVDNNIWEDDFWGDWCFDFLKEEDRAFFRETNFTKSISWNQFHEKKFPHIDFTKILQDGRDIWVLVMKMQILLWWQWKWCLH